MSQILSLYQSSLPISAGPVVQASDGRTAMPGLLSSGTTLTASANGSTTTLVVTANPGVSSGQALSFKTGANTTGYAYCASQSGSGPYTITFSPAAPNATLTGDTVLLCDLGVLISKDAGAFAPPASAALTDIGRGYYALAPNSADFNTVGELKIAWDVYGATAGVSNEKEYQVTAGVPASVAGYASGQDPATLALDAAASAHNTANTIGAKINSAGSAGDPWSTPLPGSYGSGSAGNIVGSNLNASVSSRSTYSGADTAGTTTLLSRITGAVAPQSGDSYSRLGAPAGASVSADIAAASAALAIITGLVGQNQGVRNQSYDTNGNLLSADICCYDSAAHAALNDGATGLVHRWGLALTYSGARQATQSLSQVS